MSWRKGERDKTSTEAAVTKEGVEVDGRMEKKKGRAGGERYPDTRIQKQVEKSMRVGGGGGDDS